MTASLGVPVREAVIAGLAADVKPTVDTDGADVAFNYQWKDDASIREQVFTNSLKFDQEAAALRAGRNYRQETGRFVLTLLVAAPDSTAQEAADRTDEIANAIADWISDRKSGEGLGIAGLQTLTIDGAGGMDEMFGPNGVLVILELPIKFTARLT